MEQFYNLPWYFWPIVIWSAIWKGLALWKSARLEQKWWFVALFVINTAGILEILYLFVFSKKPEQAVQEQNANN